MNIQTIPSKCNPDPAPGDGSHGAAISAPEKPRPITAHDFFQAVSVRHATGVQAIVTLGSRQQPNDHAWSMPGDDVATFLANQSHGRKPAYFSMAAFIHDAVSRWRGRTAENAVALRGWCFDIEGSAKKYAKPGGPQSGYPDGQAALMAIKAFVRASLLKPNLLVFTGSGGVHTHFLSSERLTPAEWLRRAKTLVKLAALHELKIDAPCTTDAARIMRAPGSIHQDSGAVVQAYRWREEPYQLAEFDKLIGYANGMDVIPGKRPTNIKANPAGTALTGSTVYAKYSYLQAAQRCGAMNQAAQRAGRDIKEPVWMLALQVAVQSIEGRELAHSISVGHLDYDQAATDKKIDSRKGGPAGCEAWANAYGTGGPCESCAYRGKIKNPAIQLGALVDTTAPGSVAAAASESVVEWVAELNTRYALVRHGSKLIIVDFQTPSMTGRGLARGFGILDVAAFRATLNGRFAPVQKAGDKQRSLADAWLAHPQRRQYEGLVYAPGEPLPGNILNLWQGFAVFPVAGDVSLWLEVLTALVPNEADRRYVLNWLAWKVQNPGGIPDTILIFKGAKGAGKNSLFDPLLLLFGLHAMLATDPELIAGRFTFHLMYLSFAVLDEAVFIQDPRQADRIKARVTAKVMHYEQKGMDPVTGINRCAFVMLTNHDYVWQATNDERRAVVIEVGEPLRGRLEFWDRYHAWAAGEGPAALLHYLQSVDLTGFNPRAIPKGEALRKQVEQTALRSPAAAWWYQCLTEGAIRWRDGIDRVTHLDDSAETEIDRVAMRLSYEQSAAGKYRNGSDWASVAKRLISWAGPAGIRKVRARHGTGREWRDVLPPLPALRVAFTAATQVEVDQ